MQCMHWMFRHWLGVIVPNKWQFLSLCNKRIDLWPFDLAHMKIIHLVFVWLKSLLRYIDQWPELLMLDSPDILDTLINSIESLSAIRRFHHFRQPSTSECDSRTAFSSESSFALFAIKSASTAEKYHFCLPFSSNGVFHSGIFNKH